MKHSRTSEEIEEKAALYALGALSQHEAYAFETHLREECKVCSEELSGFEEVTASLGYAAGEVSPPDFLRDVLMTRVERESRLLTPVIGFPEESSRKSEPPQKPALRLNSPIPWALAASLAIAALAAIILWKQATDQATALRNDLAAARSENQSLEQLRSIMASSGLRLIQLGGQEAAPDSHGNIYWDVENNRWAVTVSLPPPPSGKVYQLWFVTAEANLSAGLIKTAHDGKGTAVIEVPRDISHIAAAAITLEPEGGSLQPTMPIYAMGKASS